MEPFHTLQSPKPDTDSTGTGVPFLASTAWVYAPGTNNFPKTKRVCFCVRFPPLCVTYLQQHETVNMFETKNIDAQHGSSCEFYNVAVLICSLPTPGSRIFNMFDVPCGSMPSLCQPHAFQLLDAKKQIHTAIGRPFRMSVPVVAIYFFNKKRKKTRRGTEDRNHNTIGLTQKPKTTTKSLRKYGLTVRVRGAARHRRRHLSTDDTHPKLYHESAIVRWTVPRAVDLQTAGRRFFLMI